jgi:hypothetical protein
VYEEDIDFNYSGVFECRMKSLYSADRVSTLLTENSEQSADWESRGRFLLGHLIGSCASYPDWGRVRTFRLRGMKLTIQISDEKILIDKKKQTGELKSFRFSISLKRDPTAHTSISAPSSIKEPEWFYKPLLCFE